MNIPIYLPGGCQYRILRRAVIFFQSLLEVPTVTAGRHKNASYRLDAMMGGLEAIDAIRYP